MKTIAILGSTGSIGKNTLKVISQLKNKFKVIALSAGKNASVLAEQINEFRPRLAAITDGSKLASLKKTIKSPTKLFAGPEGIDAVAACAAEIMVVAIGGSVALLPTLKSLEKSQRLALANKECLVMAGDIVMHKAKECSTEIIPIDSEHSAIFQCLKEEDRKSLDCIYLTGTGGPLRKIAKEAFEFIEPDFALRHPHWKMGKKISIDSATLMNKGFEVIEANYLFGLTPDKIKVLIHPEAIVHSLVQFIDGTILAQLAVTDMCVPIQYALTYPQRMMSKSARLNFSDIENLSFHLPDLTKFPCLSLAMQVAKQKGLAGAALCAADEECVWAYLSGKIKITDFSWIIEDVLANLQDKTNPSLEEILQTDKWSRQQVKEKILKNTCEV